MLRYFAAAVLLPLVLAAQSPKWKRQYYYDDPNHDLVINDLKFFSPNRGIAVGFLTQRRNPDAKPKPASLVTSDGGSHWTLITTKEAGISLFLLDDATGWMVTQKAIWQTVDFGSTWTKLKELGGIHQVYFLNRERGFAVGAPKAVFSTDDGGKSWTPVAEAEKPDSKAEYTSYNVIDFMNPRNGIIVGGYEPPRRDDTPDWVDPARAERRREWPTLSIMLETRDGGVSWKSSTAPLLGHADRLRLAPDGVGLSLFSFEYAFDYPSEVYRIDLKTGVSSISFHAKDRLVTDMALLPGKHAWLAAIEPPGKIPTLPIPGKVVMLSSDDLKTWHEMPVDYRAVATHVVLAPVDADHIWAATDTGMILQLVKP